MRPRREPRNDLVAREADAKEAFERAKLAKLTAEWPRSSRRASTRPVARPLVML